MNKMSPEEIARIVAEYQPRRKPRFGHLVDWHDLIESLRKKGAAFDAITEILRQRGVQASREHVRHYCRETFDAISTNRRRAAPRLKSPARTNRGSDDSPKVASAPPSSPSPPKHTIPVSEKPANNPTKRGPRIAQIELLDSP